MSVFHSPELDSHFYLQPRTIQWLLPEEQQAVYEGFGRAITAGYAGSAHDLAGFYRELGRYFEAAEVGRERLPRPTTTRPASTIWSALGRTTRRMAS